jgi:murein DD-endopeptidase MepM/ murein hydrolase activator NlpD
MPIKKIFERFIHPRRLIIASEKKVMQFTISVPAQLAVLFVMSCGVLWSFYATGSFISSRSRLEAQSNTIRSVTSAKVNDILTTMFPASPFLKTQAVNPEVAGSLAPIDSNKAKLAMLEQQVNELKTANEAIVERVRLKTDGHIDDLESIVRQTGLNPLAIKKQAEKIQKSGKQANDINKETGKEDAEGGPYIPTEMPKIPDDASQMLESLDELQALRKVVATLPLGVPVENAEEHSQFGHRIDPFNGNLAFHSGLDLAGPPGSLIHSTADGTVISAGRDGSYGNMVDIDHGLGIVTRYGHMSEIKVHKGDKVKKGAVIGVQGSTGRSTGEHLHYEVRYNGQPINPENFLQTGKFMEVGNAVPQD